MISAPGSPASRTEKNITGLAPGVISTELGSISAPCLRRRSAATASRSSGMPAAGVYPCRPSRSAATPASTMLGGVAKSGWPMPRLMIERPSAASRLASASTSNAVSVPIRPTAAAGSIIAASFISLPVPCRLIGAEDYRARR